MSNYLRARAKGACYFFTVNLAQRGDDLLARNIDDLRAAYRLTMAEHPVRCDAMVVLPDHLHAVWTLPPGDADFSIRWKKIKTRFTKAVGASRPCSVSKRAKGEKGIWQRRFWEHMIRDEADFAAHTAYCWGNPVKHGLAEKPTDWPYSSIHRDIALGLVGPDWLAVDGRVGDNPPSPLN